MKMNDLDLPILHYKQTHFFYAMPHSHKIPPVSSIHVNSAKTTINPIPPKLLCNDSRDVNLKNHTSRKMY